MKYYLIFLAVLSATLWVMGFLIEPLFGMVAIPSTAALIILRPKKCPNCKMYSQQTGERGSEFHQYYCDKCENTFWCTNDFLREYERDKKG